MNSFELFCLIFYALDSVWDESKNEELGHYLSSANPFFFRGIGSANPEVYENFQQMIPEKITVSDSFNLAKKYVDTLESESISKAFQCIGYDRWNECAKSYLSSPHKGQDSFNESE